jgi:hypothetical protein
VGHPPFTQELALMKNYDQFHDGSFDGLLIDRAAVTVFLSTNDKQPFVIEAKGVAAIIAGGFKAGNIIFEVLVREHVELVLRDVTEVYGLPPVSDAVGRAQELLRDAIERRLMVLEINPSYGANCLVLAESIILTRRN